MQMAGCIRYLLWLILSVASSLLAVSSAADYVDVAGEDSYTYGDSESLVVARQTARLMAIRRAIESYRLFLDATTTVKDNQVVSDLVKTIAAGHLHNLKIEESQQGNTIRVRVKARVLPGEIKSVLDQALRTKRGNLRGGGISGDLDCSDFPSQAAAQAQLRTHPSDPNHLDRNRDGIACESNPPPELLPV